VRLAQRLLLGSLLVVSALVILVVTISDRRLDDTLLAQASEQLAREAGVVGARWRPGANADSLADVWGAAFNHHVTLVDTTGTVLGDSEFGAPALGLLGSRRDSPDIAPALQMRVGSPPQVGVERGDAEAYAVQRVPSGVVRVALPLRRLELITRGARQDVLFAGVIALIVAGVLAYLFSRAVSTPIVELRDVARALAAGDLSRRPRLAAPGEVGDLATALHRMADQLAARLNALEADDALMAALVEALNEGVIAVDPGRRIVRINESGRRLLGLRGPVPIPVDHLPRERALREALDDALAGRVPPPTEIRVEDRTLALTARPLASGGGVIALFDLTPIRRLEMVRRDFVANVSHELKTPLTVIGGFAETLVDDDLPPAQRRRFAETIQAHSLRMQRIVDDLLDISRIESGGWRPNPSTVDVGALGGEVVSALHDVAARKRITIDIRPDDAARTIFADPTAVRQILSNLIENAIRYTPDGGTVTVFSEPQPGGVRIGVRDTGVGIAPEHLPRIFERFYRVDASRAREAGGTGLGLAIVRHLVEAHGGRVRAESAVGRGTTVMAFFPTPDASDANAE
jgi:signal transduction histidine kinase